MIEQKKPKEVRRQIKDVIVQELFKIVGCGGTGMGGIEKESKSFDLELLLFYCFITTFGCKVNGNAISDIRDDSLKYYVFSSLLLA